MLIKYNNIIKEINEKEYLTAPDTYKIWKEGAEVKLAFSPLSGGEVKYLTFSYQEGEIIKVGTAEIKV